MIRVDVPDYDDVLLGAEEGAALHEISRACGQDAKPPGTPWIIAPEPYSRERAWEKLEEDGS